MVEGEVLAKARHVEHPMHDVRCEVDRVVLAFGNCVAERAKLGEWQTGFVGVWTGDCFFEVGLFSIVPRTLFGESLSDVSHYLMLENGTNLDQNSDHQYRHIATTSHPCSRWQSSHTNP